MDENIDKINELMDRLEAKLDEMDRKISALLEYIEEYNKSSKIVTHINDGEIMFRYKNNNNE